MNITSQGFDGLYLLVDKAGMPVQRSAIVQGGRAPRFEGAKGYDGVAEPPVKSL